MAGVKNAHPIPDAPHCQRSAAGRSRGAHDREASPALFLLSCAKTCGRRYCLLAEKAAMDKIETLQETGSRILAQIAAMEPMRRGSSSEQWNETVDKNGKPARRGRPCPLRSRTRQRPSRGSLERNRTWLSTASRSTRSAAIDVCPPNGSRSRNVRRIRPSHGKPRQPKQTPDHGRRRGRVLPLGVSLGPLRSAGLPRDRIPDLEGETFSPGAQRLAACAHGRPPRPAPYRLTRPKPHAYIAASRGRTSRRRKADR